MLLTEQLKKITKLYPDLPAVIMPQKQTTSGIPLAKLGISWRHADKKGEQTRGACSLFCVCAR